MIHENKIGEILDFNYLHLSKICTYTVTSFYGDEPIALIDLDGLVATYLQDYYTPLYAASARGLNDMVKILIAANADVNCFCKVSY